VNDRGYVLVSLSRPSPVPRLAIRRRYTAPGEHLPIALVFLILGLVGFGGSTGRLVGTALVFVWQIIDVRTARWRALGESA
jgi:hypothetical protein